MPPFLGSSPIYIILVRMIQVAFSGNMSNYGPNDYRYPRPLWWKVLRSITSLLWSLYFALYLGACLKGLYELIQSDKLGIDALLDSTKVLRVLLLRDLAHSLKIPPVSGILWLIAFGIISIGLFGAARIAQADSHTEGFVLDLRESVRVSSTQL